jgi:hypothetical protein
VEEVMAHHGKVEATFRASDTSELRPIQFKVQELFLGTNFMRPEMFSEEYGSQDTIVFLFFYGL